MLLKSLIEHDFLYFDPLSLLACHKVVSHFGKLLDPIEIVNDDPHKQIDDKLGAKDHKADEVEDEPWICISLRLQVNSPWVYPVVHDWHPAFGGDHLEEHENCGACIIKIDIFVLPKTAHF